MEHYKEIIDLYFELKNSPESTRESYWRRMKFFLTYMERNLPVEEMTLENVQQFILYLKRERGLSAGTINNYISSVRFFYTYALEKEWNIKKVPRMKRKTKIPVIPPKEDVLTLLNATDNLKHKAILTLLYSSGLRVSEVAKLKIGDICSKSMRIRVEEAKHSTDRYTILSDTALLVLRSYFKTYFSNTAYTRDDWLFPGQSKENHINVKTIKNTVLKLREKLEMDSRISAHTLRHCFSTHALEDGIELIYIQQMLGHKRLETTSKYLHMTSKGMMGIKSPLDSQGSSKA
ncbi:tyrosine-type recombinase/integrase [Halalkalibacter okhensis]|uniref:Integrase n=1 Tax=Halalkalibacter okhensis TaxID=333138 RepID=A0A0B0IKY5_9BACI|nr:site-specific integrase [Halalkalibacter okhensis]KHF41552.1 integrase [Halalkalibacter okhensis]